MQSVPNCRQPRTLNGKVWECPTSRLQRTDLQHVVTRDSVNMSLGNIQIGINVTDTSSARLHVAGQTNHLGVLKQDYCWLGPPLWSSGQSSWLHKGDNVCFLWGTNWIYLCYVEKSRPPLWSSGQSSWLQIQSALFDSRRYLIFWQGMGLERGPLSLVTTTEELLDRKVTAPV
jgi:hypothetical protein